MASMKSPIDLREEPTLDELMSDPIIQLVMHRDGVNARDVHSEMDRVRMVFALPESA